MKPGFVYDVGELSVATGMSAAEIMTLLTRLELGGVVRRVAAGRFVRAS